MSDEPKGVNFSPPPPKLLEQAETLVKNTFAHLPPGTNGALVGVATSAGWNAAVVHRTDNEHVEVAAWIGKNWGDKLSGGSVVRVTW